MCTQRKDEYKLPLHEQIISLSLWMVHLKKNDRKLITNRFLTSLIIRIIVHFPKEKRKKTERSVSLPHKLTLFKLPNDDGSVDTFRSKLIIGSFGIASIVLAVIFARNNLLFH